MANKNERRLTIGSISDSVKIAELIDTVHGMARELIAKDEIISNQQALLAQRDERVQDLVTIVLDLEARLDRALVDGSDHDNLTAPNEDDVDSEPFTVDLQTWLATLPYDDATEPIADDILNTLAADDAYAARNDTRSRVHVLRGKRGYSSGSYEVVGQVGEYIRYRDSVGNVATVLATKTKAA